MRIGKMTAAGAFAVLGIGFCLSRPASAEFVINITQQGNDVVAVGSGTINLTGAFSAGTDSAAADLHPSASAEAILGLTTATDMDGYKVDEAPSNFGTGGLTAASSGNGDQAGVTGITVLVPSGYVSGDPLSDTDTYDNATFSSLGLAVGTYTWVLRHDDVVINVEAPTSVPEPASLVLLGSALLGLAAARRAT